MEQKKKRIYRKRIPYGMMNFEDVRKDDCYYVDKTPLNLNFSVVAAGIRICRQAQRLCRKISRFYLQVRKQLSGKIHEPGRAGSLCGRKPQPCS